MVVAALYLHSYFIIMTIEVNMQNVQMAPNKVKVAFWTHCDYFDKYIFLLITMIV